MERALNRVLELGRSAVEHARDPVERLRLGLRAHLEALLSGDDDFYVLLYDWRSLQGPAMQGMLRLRARYESFWDDLLHEAVRAGWVHPGVDVELLRQFGIGAMNWVAQWRHETDPRTPEQIADSFWTYLAFGLLAEDKRRALLGKPLARARIPASLTPVGQMTKERKPKSRRRAEQGKRVRPGRRPEHRRRKK
jgi:hypothetical protein